MYNIYISSGKMSHPQFEFVSFPAVQTVLLLRAEQVRGDVTSPFFNTSLLSVWIYNEYHNRCRDKTNLISCADMSVCCHSVERSLPLHKHGAAHRGSVYSAHTYTPWLQWTCSYKHEARETGRKGDLSVQLAFCSAGSNVACLPGGPLRQERVHRDPTGPPPSQTADRGPVWKLYRDPITHHTAKHCSGHQMTSFPHLTLYSEGECSATERVIRLSLL